MNPKHLTLRALQPGADLSPDAHHVVPVDALHALGRCKHPLASALLRCRLGDLVAEEVADSMPMMQLVAWVMMKKKWAVYDREGCPAIDTMRNFGLQCLREWLGEKCPSCQGRDHRYTKGGVVYLCQTCNGTGRLRDPVRIRAKMLAMTPEAIRQTWAERFDYLIGELSIIERRGWNGERQFFGEE